MVCRCGQLVPRCAKEEKGIKRCKIDYPMRKANHLVVKKKNWEKAIFHDFGESRDINLYI